MDANVPRQSVWMEPDYDQPKEYVPSRYRKPVSYLNEEARKERINQHRINGWLTYEAKQMCLQDKRCFRCLETTHRTRDCPVTRERTCGSCQKIGHRTKECPFINNTTTTEWFKGPARPGPVQGLGPTAIRPDMGALPMNNLPKAQYLKEGRCFSCQLIGHRRIECPTQKMHILSTEQDKQATSTVASVLRGIKAMTAEDRLGLVQTLLGLEEDIGSTYAEGSVTSTQQNIEALEHWETPTTSVKIRAMQVQPKKLSQQQAKSGSSTPPQTPAIRLGTMKLGETKDLENPQIPTYIRALPSRHPGGLGQRLLKGYTQLAQAVRSGPSLATIWAIQMKTSIQVPKDQHHPITQKERHWWQEKRQQIMTQGAVKLQSVQVRKTPKARARKMTQIQRTVAKSGRLVKTQL